MKYGRCLWRIYPILIFGILFLNLACDKTPTATPETKGQMPGEESQDKHRQAADCCVSDVLLQEQDMEAFAAFVAQVWKTGRCTVSPLPQRFDTPAQAVYVALRSRGRRLTEVWETRGTTGEALSRAIQEAQRSLDAVRVDSVDTLEIALSHSYRQFYLDREESKRTLLSNIHRGVRGLEIDYPGVLERYSPTYVLASNRDNNRLIELFLQRNKVSQEQLIQQGRLFQFDAEQVLVHLSSPASATLMERGNVFVPPQMVTHANVLKTAQLAGRWLANNVHEDGRMTYKYWPASASESKANNQIRQWMATVALIRFALANKNEELLALAEKNINYNLNTFYFEENGFGQLDCQGTVKLGALGLACLALLEHPRRAQWGRYEWAMQNTINALWHENGAFTTFFKPRGENRNQNFYPGEALLYWAFLYRDQPDAELFSRFTKSFEYYRAWHLNPVNRNPAFVPWHTQAYYVMWNLKENDLLSEFIFEMNDWLLPVQQWSVNTQYRDTLGRFYDPSRPFGPPHSSSTGVYLEGLIDAFALARKLGDEKRMNAYRIAINRGLRSVMQLQFADDVDMYYVSPTMRPYVEGGIRTTVYNNEIRCDNVQHNLMGILKILEIFDESDYGRFD